MIRSNINTERSDFNVIKNEDHIEKVWEIIEKNVPVYFNKMIEDLASVPDQRKRLGEIFEDGLNKFHKVDNKYKSFFGEESMQEFEDEDNPKDFKSKLAIEIPLIRKALQSKYEAMKEWQQKFSWAKATDVYGIFFNLITFMNDFVDETDESAFSGYNELKDWKNLIVLNDDDDYNVPGVIGMGIKSSILYFLNPTFFLSANKNILYGFYFLSDCEHFRLPSGSNEFIMINDQKEGTNRRYNRNMLIDQNYWYPYDLFGLYSLRTYRLLEQLCVQYGYKLSTEYRFVHVHTFMAQIWDLKIDIINTMTGGDQEEAR